MMKKENRHFVLALSFMAAIAFVILAVIGCEDPSPEAIRIMYDRVEVHNSNITPPMNDPNNDIWDNPAHCYIWVHSNNTVSSRVEIQAIKADNRIYLKTNWNDNSYNSLPEKITFSRTFKFETVITEIQLSSNIDSVTTYEIGEDSTDTISTYINFTYEWDTTYTTPVGITDAPDSIIRNICDSIGMDTSFGSVIANDTTWNVTMLDRCTTTYIGILVTDSTIKWDKSEQFILGNSGITNYYNPVDSPAIDSADTNFINTASDQDRLAVMWDIGDNGAEGANCALMCHDDGDTTDLGHRMYTTGGGHVDVWHWQSATTDPVMLASDEYWSVLGRKTDESVTPVIQSNYDSTSIQPQPMYMHNTDSMFKGLFLHADEAIAFSSDVYWPNGYSMPGFVVNDFASGSGADVSSYSRYNRSRNTWTVILSRDLTTATGVLDDIDLSTISAGDSVMISIAVMDNADRLHASSKPFYIVFP